MKFFIIVILVFIHTTLSSHYRGSMVTWRILNSSSTTAIVELLQRHTWHYYTALCNDIQIAAKNKYIGSGSLNCYSSCPLNISTLASVSVPCTAYNIPENFTSGEGRTLIELPVNRTLTAVFEGANWFTLLQGGGNWSMAVQISTKQRTNGRYNQAPIVTMLPIIRLRLNRTYNVRIYVADNDFDPYQCFWSMLSYECGGICMAIPATTVLNSTSCIITFTPPKIGYYAIALTVADYETITSTTQLSRVPIQFLFKIWNSNNTCSLPPLYVGEVPPDQCIYMQPGQVMTMRILIKIQCPNATLSNVIGIYPAGFSRSPANLDPYDSTVSVFLISYTARVEQIGQNLYCFAGVDSVGNQADTTCLRFTVQQDISSMNTLYLLNTTRFPTGVVSQTQSIWTLIYPNGTAFSRPTIAASIRFKYASSQQDFLIINVAKAINVDYQSDRLVISTSVIFPSGASFYISFDPGVFVAASTCLRDSMEITDPNFWTFDIPAEGYTTTTTATTPTTKTSQTTTLRSRTSPTLRTISLTPLPSVTTTKPSTTAYVWMTQSMTTEHIPTEKKNFPISGIVGILLGSLVFIACLIRSRPLLAKMKDMWIRRHPRIERSSVPRSVTEAISHYRVKVRMNKRASINENYESVEDADIRTISGQDSVIVKHQLVEIEV